METESAESQAEEEAAAAAGSAPKAAPELAPAEEGNAPTVEPEPEPAAAPASPEAEFDPASAPPSDFSALRMVTLEGFQPPFSLTGDELDAHVRRYGTLFVADKRSRRGGSGRVLYAENAWGDKLAVKVLESEAYDGLPEKERAAAEALREASFRREYESNRLLTGIAGFPKLFGRAKMDGQQALVMEWIEGETLGDVRRRLSVDDDGRSSPLVAAALGRDLFDLLARMAMVDGGLVHRDISPANVMVRTTGASVEEQAARGAFDLVLVDFGSTAIPARASSITVRYGAPQGATPDFAPPEMLTSDVANVAEMRKNPAVDVYAAASVVYLLLCGHPPFDLGRAAGDGEVTSDYLRKANELPRPIRMVHEQSPNVTVAPAWEGFADEQVRAALSREKLAPSGEELQAALVRADGQVAEIVLAALEPSQAARPTAAQMRDGFADFVRLYPQNVVNAVQGRPLVRGSVPERRAGEGGRAWTGGTVGRAGRRAALAVAVAVACVAGVLCAGARAILPTGAAPLEVELTFPLVAVGLLVPAAFGYLVRWKGARSFAGFLRGSVALALTAAAAEAVLAVATVQPDASRTLLACALAAASSAAWCGMVLEYSMSAPSAWATAKRPAQGVSGKGGSV